MAEERTEAPTPKRRQEVRRRGETARSRDLTTAVVLLAGLFGLRLLMGTLRDRLAGLIVDSITAIGTFDKTSAPGNQVNVVGPVLAILAPLLGLLVMAAVVGGIVQGSFVFAPGLLAPRGERVSPLAGIKRIISLQGLVQTLKTLAKFAIVAVTGYLVINSHLNELTHLGTADLPAATATMLSMCWELGFKCALALLALGAADWLWERRRFLRSIRMTKQELREELRDTEGDPQIRARLRRRREQLVREMLKNVRTADVLITNPTHFAVALKYDPVSMAAPTVVAKGVDYLAQRLREAAVDAHVAVYQNPPLARTLYRTVQVGEQIPPDLYMAVAEVLAFVFRLRAASGDPIPQPAPAG